MQSCEDETNLEAITLRCCWAQLNGHFHYLSVSGPYQMHY